VGGAVVVAKTLLQTQRSGTKPVIAQLAKMVDRVTVAPARAAILWLLGEHCERLPHLPPDVLRKMAKTFPDEVSYYYVSDMSCLTLIRLKLGEESLGCYI
jgi:AP-3 complex subunit beta